MGAIHIETMACPKCGTIMDDIRGYDWNEYWTCHGCQGKWEPNGNPHIIYPGSLADGDGDIDDFDYYEDEDEDW